MNDLQLILTSAVVSAAVSSSMTLLGQYFERKSRESEAKVARDERLRELFLSKALELTLEEYKVFIEENRKPVVIFSLILLRWQSTLNI